MDTDGEVFRKRAYNAEAILELTLTFIQNKGLYDEYMKWKENSDEIAPCLICGELIPNSKYSQHIKQDH